MRRVIVTRPEPGASQTASRLEALGFAPVLLPLSATNALFVDRASIPDEVGAVAVTSANAIRHAPRELVEMLARTTCFAVGERSADSARAAGFLRVSEGSGDARSLARAIVAANPEGPVLYICGRVRRPDFEKVVADAGIAVKAVEVYDTLRSRPATDSAASILGGLPVDAALLYSAAAAEALLELLDPPELAHLFENTEFLCLSARIAGVLEGKVRDKICIPSEPTEEALLSMLGKSG